MYTKYNKIRVNRINAFINIIFILQPYPFGSKKIPRMERITGRAMPFWLRRKSPTSKIENQRPSKYQKQKNRNPVKEMKPHGGQLYNSYRKFNPDQYRENSPQWKMVIHQYLLDMRQNGHHVNEVTVDKVKK